MTQYCNFDEICQNSVVVYMKPLKKDINNVF